jgi:hypothetical protein
MYSALIKFTTSLHRPPPSLYLFLLPSLPPSQFILDVTENRNTKSCNCTKPKTSRLSVFAQQEGRTVILGRTGVEDTSTQAPCPTSEQVLKSKKPTTELRRQRLGFGYRGAVQNSLTELDPQ